ncbi:MAG: type sorting protein, partial [Chitinophagaceae bacterium]|nr:type sorting protein [Chitinophagaceae bacterium]
MKKGLLFLVFACASIVSFATHIAAGELYYVYEGPGAAANTSRYKITMKLFRDCSSVGQDLNAEGVTIGIYNNPALSRHTTLSLTKQWTGAVPSIQNTNGANPCLSPFVSICYHVGTFSNSIDLPNTPGGYTLAWVRFTRTALENVVAGGFIGATFITQIPGTTQLPSGTNNSAQFVTKDTSTICKNTSFSIDFSATDSNGDSLSYAFTSAYDGTPDPANPTNPSPPPPLTLSLPSLNYTTGYSGAAPLGPGVTINPQTGIISGVAPTVPDYYVICVVVSEWRGGVRIYKHSKDFILKVGDCSMTGAELAPSYITCDGFSWTFQ